MSVKTPKFERDCKRFISKRILTQDQIDETINIYLTDLSDHRIRLHPITCKHDKNRKSITVIGTQYRILLTIENDSPIFVRLVDHDEYDRINKDC